MPGITYIHIYLSQLCQPAQTVFTLGPKMALGPGGWPSQDRSEGLGHRFMMSEDEKEDEKDKKDEKEEDEKDKTEEKDKKEEVKNHTHPGCDVQAFTGMSTSFEPPDGLSCRQWLALAKGNPTEGTNEGFERLRVRMMNEGTNEGLSSPNSDFDSMQLQRTMRAIVDWPMGRRDSFDLLVQQLKPLAILRLDQQQEKEDAKEEKRRETGGHRDASH